MLALLFLLSFSAQAQPIEGHWFFHKKIYQGQEMPEPPSATLRMHFVFSPPGESTLSWWHEGEEDHCARKAVYSVEGNLLLEEVIWVDPENSSFCAEDPDMQLGKKSRTPFYFYGNDLAIRFYLGDEPLDLIWRKLPAK